MNRRDAIKLGSELAALTGFGLLARRYGPGLDKYLPKEQPAGINQQVMDREYKRLDEFVIAKITEAKRQNKQLAFVTASYPHYSNANLSQMMFYEICARHGLRSINLGRSESTNNAQGPALWLFRELQKDLSKPDGRENFCYFADFQIKQMEQEQILAFGPKAEFLGNKIAALKCQKEIISQVESSEYLSAALLFALRTKGLFPERDKLIDRYDADVNKKTLEGYYNASQLYFIKLLGLEIVPGTVYDSPGRVVDAATEKNLYGDFVKVEANTVAETLASLHGDQIVRVPPLFLMGFLEGMKQRPDVMAVGLDMVNVSRQVITDVADLELNKVYHERHRQMQSLWHTELPMMPQLTLEEGLSMIILASGKAKLASGELSQEQFFKLNAKVHKNSPQLAVNSFSR